MYMQVCIYQGVTIHCRIVQRGVNVDKAAYTGHKEPV